MFFFICYNLDNDITNNSLFFNEQNKFKIYEKLINSNYNDKLLNIFTKSQNIYHKLNNLVYKYKLNKYKLNNDSDMYLDTINLKSKNIIKLLIDNKVFIFTIKDINHIINNNLLHLKSSSYIYPLKLRNPYTNNIIKLNNLYNIHFSLRNKNVFSHVYYLFFKKNFDLNKLLIEYKHLLYHELFLYNIYHSSDKYLYENIINMFTSVRNYYNIVYFLNYDKEIIISKYKKLLIYYFIYTCNESSINTSITNKIYLLDKLFSLIDKNRLFEVIKNKDIFKIINSDYINDDFLYYLNNIETENNSLLNNENLSLNETSLTSEVSGTNVTSDSGDTSILNESSFSNETQINTNNTSNNNYQNSNIRLSKKNKDKIKIINKHLLQIIKSIFKIILNSIQFYVLFKFFYNTTNDIIQ